MLVVLMLRGPGSLPCDPSDAETKDGIDSGASAARAPRPCAPGKMEDKGGEVCAGLSRVRTRRIGGQLSDNPLLCVAPPAFSSSECHIDKIRSKQSRLIKAHFRDGGIGICLRNGIV